jgi:hypothetical protein
VKHALLLLIFGVVFSSHASANFTFTMNGDFGQGYCTDSSLKGGEFCRTIKNIVTIKPAFHIAVGDFAYADNHSYYEGSGHQLWSAKLKEALMWGGIPNLPFELVAGNHDTIYNTAHDLMIGNPSYRTDLPHRINNITVGRYGYGAEFYFDYPDTTNPIARFIQISPGGDIFGWWYTQGDVNRNWLENAITEAQQKNLWLFVSMHNNCLTIGKKYCGGTAGTMGLDLFNYLVNKRVDFIMQGHDHVYERSKQLGFNSQCTAFTLTSNRVTYNEACIVKNSQNQQLDGYYQPYAKGLGTVVLINGLGGVHDYYLNDIVQKNYFGAYLGKTGGMGSLSPLNTNGLGSQYGVSKLTVTADKVTGTFEPNPDAGYSYRDSFTMFRGNFPTPTLQTTKTGDANGDGKVDEADYGIWRTNYNQTKSGGASIGDFNGNGKVEGMDYVLWRQHYSP